jgi:hypothetical protein
VKTVGGEAGVEKDRNGVADNAVLTWADAVTLSGPTVVNLIDFHITNGSTIQLTANSDNYSLFGNNWTLQLNNQSVDGAYFEGGVASGVGTSATEVHYHKFDIGTLSVQKGHFTQCVFNATVTMTLAGDYNFHDGKSGIAGIGGPTFTKTAGQTITAQWRNWDGSITVSGIQASDVLTISGTELGDIVLNGAEGTVKILGIYESLTDNRTGSPILIIGAFEGSDVTDTLIDTADMQPKLGTPTAADMSTDIANMQIDIDTIITTLGLLNDLSSAEVNAEVVDALSVDTYAESTSVPSAVSSIAAKLTYIYDSVANKSTQTSTTRLLRNRADAGTISTATVSDDGTTFVKGVET